MVVVKLSDKVEGSGDNIYAPLYSGLYKEEDDYLVLWSGKYPDENMDCFTWYKEDTDWIVPEDQYNEEFNKWRGPIHNVKLLSQTFNDKRKTEDTCYKYARSAKFNVIPRERKPAIPIKYYKDQCRENMIRNGMWDLFYLPDPCNKENKWDLFLH